MNTNKRKSIAAVLTMSVLLSTLLFPYSASAERYPPYKWTIISSEFIGYVDVGALTYYDTDTANSTGETTSVTILRSSTGGVFGELKVSYLILSAKLGFDCRDTVSISKTKTSRLLKKGEIVHSYFQHRNSKYKIVQIGRSAGQQNLTRTIYVLEPFGSDIIFIYK